MSHIQKHYHRHLFHIAYHYIRPLTYTTHKNLNDMFALKDIRIECHNHHLDHNSFLHSLVCKDSSH